MLGTDKFSPLAVTPYKVKPHKGKKEIRDYHDMPLSAARKRKIEHVQRMMKEGQPRGRVFHHAIHNMHMHGNDIVAAMEE
ncbi:MAG: hypothetical protein LC650_00400 [Actinobacteria bacterium]|nr:hypothetical protein [Actinomycetota bacterium]